MSYTLMHFRLFVYFESIHWSKNSCIYSIEIYYWLGWLFYNLRLHSVLDMSLFFKLMTNKQSNVKETVKWTTTIKLKQRKPLCKLCLWNSVKVTPLKLQDSHCWLFISKELVNLWINFWVFHRALVPSIYLHLITF